MIPSYSAYKFSQLKTVIIPDECIEILDYAFNSTTLLENINIENIKYFDNYSFSQSGYNLNEISNNAIRFGRDSFSKTNASFSYIPSNVITIGQSAFSNCPNIAEHLTIEGNAELSIQDNAFASCTQIKSITFKSKPSSISSNAFKYMTGLTDIYVPWSENELFNAPWSAPATATIHYNTEV